jgi:phosphoglycerate dehydrogenase-like enzyme
VGQHRDMPPPAREHRSLGTGPISLAPTSSAIFEEAATLAGAQLVEVGPDTRGLVWLSEKHAEDLSAVLSEFPGIEWVQLPWAGVDAFSSVLKHLASKPAGQRPVVTSAKGAYSEPVAEHAVALLLGCMRELPRKARDAYWQPERTGLSLFERHIVLVGAGGISRAFMDMVAPYRARVTVVRRQNIPVEGADRTITSDQLADVLPTADALVLAAAATTSTRHLIGAPEFALMPEHAVVVNIARGTLLDLGAFSII